ncbi:gamma-glutamyl-gamma-aminobutyrate hydrolase family protein [Spirochaetota bacterium]
MIKKILALAIALPIIITACKKAPPGKKIINIGMTYGTLQTATYKGGKDFNINYKNAIIKNGGNVVRIFVTDSNDVTKEKLKKLHAVLVPGGMDVSPSFYKERKSKKLGKTDYKLDRLEFKVLNYADKKNLPVLGICRGHQIINVYYGGSLYQDIPTQYRASKRVIHRLTKTGYNSKPAYHKINIKEGSLLNRILKLNTLRVNSLHHQAVKRIAKRFTVSAKSRDGIIEAMEVPSKRFILTVQFHPEKMLEEIPVLNRIFGEFIKRAGENLKSPNNRKNK